MTPSTMRMSSQRANSNGKRRRQEGTRGSASSGKRCNGVLLPLILALGVLLAFPTKAAASTTSSHLRSSTPPKQVLEEQQELDATWTATNTTASWTRRLMRNIFFHAHTRHPSFANKYGQNVMPFAPSALVTTVHESTSSNTRTRRQSPAGRFDAPDLTTPELPRTNIVGGAVVQLEATTQQHPYPWFVQWGDFCGATLVHEDVILTAAHCLDVDMSVWLASLEHADGIPMDIDASTVRSHPEYDGGHHYDLMILKLRTPAPASNAPVVMNHDLFQPQDGLELTAIGFGVTELGSQSFDLKHVNVTKFSKERCEQAYDDGYTYVNSFMFCAGTETGGKDSCQGDSGGPIIDANTQTLMGVISHGEGCADQKYPGVYQRINVNHIWIHTHICQLSDAPPDDCREEDTVRPFYHQVKLQVQYDDFPEETGWELRRIDPDTEKVLDVILKFDFKTIVNKTPGPMYFDRLESGTYEFELKDSQGDGFCCIYGQGSAQATHVNTDTLLFDMDGQFKGRTVQRFVLEPPEIEEGEATQVQEDPEEEPAEGADIKETAGPQQQEDDELQQQEDDELQQQEDDEPVVDGRPVQFMVAIRYDFAPQETAWTLEVIPQGAADAPYVVEESKFGNVTKSQLIQTPVELTAPADYRFTILDKNDDGINGGMGQGWIELKQWDAVRNEYHILWKSNGKFGHKLEHEFSIE